MTILIKKHTGFTKNFKSNSLKELRKPYEANLPESIEIHKLPVSDEKAIFEWTKGKAAGYAEHLRNMGSWVNDDRVLEYGIFRSGTMISAVGCGIDSAHEF